MKKYLFYFGYIGTRFRGIQKQKYSLRKSKHISDYLEDSLLSLSPSNTPVVYNSSRTDAGVHALCSTFHSTLCLPPIRGRGIDKTEEECITATLNKYFENLALDIRIHKTQIVPPLFHCRHRAIQRTYLYRLAHHTVPLDKDGHNCIELPISEVNRCKLISGDFDIEAVQSACRILKGGTDFKYYTKFNKNDKRVIRTQRTLNEMKIVPGQPLFHPEYDERYENFRFWDIIISAKSFLYNQVRRMVGMLIAVGKGKFQEKDVEATILNPQMSWDKRLNVVDADGLYLLNVEYPPEAFLEETYENLTETDRQKTDEGTEQEQKQE